MDKDENVAAHEKRRLQVYADDEDVLVRVLEIPEADYECVMVNSSWPAKNLVEGDIILFAYTFRSEPAAGDIVLIEQEGNTRLGILAAPGVLDTVRGHRPLEDDERVVGVGVALARKLKS